eukprot:TRINITY_DN13879_c0_g1_i1.p1 TRINITY_DN13879_c0_g1~~TRINITY_DN13879_c0_g1_i1.p1  ORF type:complete len:391 (-),score=86.87 TRINITY_DN13879_c0_g1_i1:21-1193(-)
MDCTVRSVFHFSAITDQLGSAGGLSKLEDNKRRNSAHILQADAYLAIARPPVAIHRGNLRPVSLSSSIRGNGCSTRPTKLFPSRGLVTEGSRSLTNGGGKDFFVGDNSTYLRMTQAVFAEGAGEGRGGGALGVEMNLFDRLFRVVRAAMGSVVSGLEDPEKILDQAVEEMGNDLSKLRMTTAQVVASRRILENKYNAAVAASSEWYRRAKRALELGDESLAKEALKRRKTFEESATKLKAQLDQQQEVSDRILSSSRMLESKISEAREKKNLLKARAQSAKTSKWVGEMVSSIDTSSALAAYERMEEKVLALEAEADAVNQISTDSLETKFAALEGGASVDDDLAELRREVLGSRMTIQRELPPFEPVRRDSSDGSGRTGGRSGSSYRSY